MPFQLIPAIDLMDGQVVRLRRGEADAKTVYSDDPAAIADAIRSTPDTPRRTAIEQKTLPEIRKKVERHIKNTYLKRIQAPVGVGPVLKCWMEMN